MEEKVQKILQKAKDLSIEPSPYMATRVMARVQEQKVRQKKLFWWKLGTFASATLSLLLFVTINFKFGESQQYLAEVNRPQVVRVEVQDLKNLSVARVEVRVPEGVLFHSEKFPEIAQLQKLDFEWTKIIDKGHLPFIIRGTQTGTGEVMVLFLGEDGETLAKKKIKIKFGKGGADHA